MGSNQSRPEDGRWGLRLPRRSAIHRDQPEQKPRKSSALAVNSGGQYRHLNRTNDSSARSSPSDDPSFAYDTKCRIASKNSSSVTFCPCFHRNYRGKQTKHHDDVAPGRSCDTVALLRLTGQSDRKCPSPAELGFDGGSLQEKPDQILDGVSSQENLSVVDDALRIADGSRDEAGCTRLVLSCDDDDIQPKTVLSKIWADVNENARLTQRLEREDVGYGNEECVEKKSPSFLYDPSSSSKSKSESDQFSSGGHLTESKDFPFGEKKNSETNESDYTSAAASYVDSGKASEIAGSVDLYDRPIGIKAPIAKIDSLETTSIDSFDSDEFALDSTACSHVSVKELGVGKISDSVSKSVAPTSVCETGDFSSTSVTYGSFKDMYSGDATVDVMLNLIENPNTLIRPKGCLTVEKERRHLSCPVPGTSPSLVNGSSLLSVPSDIVSVSRENHSLSSVFQELPDWQTVSNEECVTLSRKTHSDLCSEVETVRLMLLHLGILLVHQDQCLEDDDSRNNNLVDPVAYEDCQGNNPFLQSGEMPDNAYAMQTLLSENLNLKKHIALLETVASEQQELISTLQQKLHKFQNSAPKSNIET